MSKELAVIGWTPEQVELVKKTVALDASDSELALFLTVAKRSGLDPFTRQIHFVKRGGRVTIQTGIDGYRAIAEKTGQLAGIDDAEFDTETEKHPNKASVTVYRLVEKQKVGFTASARWAEYVPASGQDFMWKKMPFLMLGKVAESLALRKAFPNNLSGLYTTEEMAQAQGYDTSPIKDDVEVQSSGDDLGPEKLPVVQLEPSLEPPKVLQFELAKKKQIKELVDSIVLNPLKTKEDYEQYVEKNTGLKLILENFDQIIIQLTKAKNGEV